ncbi:MAG: hypothetical protein IKI67_00375 [Bacteroidales bacterium]|nr:hypothetical protein [Bacteroidales bacterium]
MIVDASRGGLVLGSRHSDGGIKMILIKDNALHFVGEMEGGEFLINYIAAQKFQDRLFEINSYKGNYSPLEDSPIVTGIRKIVVPKGHLIILGGIQPIINRAATSKYLKELQEINESTINLFPAQN